MKKLIALAILGGFALMGCDSKDVNAQTMETAVGNPDSNNVLIIEEGYQAVIPLDDEPAQPDWSQEGNVEVAPDSKPNTSSAPAAATASDGMSVDESVMEMNTPNSSSVEMNETINN